MAVNEVAVRYLGDERAEVRSGDRSFLVDQRTETGRAGARFCPIELIAASLGAYVVLIMAAVAAKKGHAPSSTTATTTGGID